MDARRRSPLWLGNVVVFGVLFLAVMAYFLWQIRQAREAFREHVRANAEVVAGVVRLNARGAVLSQRMAEEILRKFLGNTARFVEYLDGIEPFTSKELSAFAQEAGLAGIRIQRTEGGHVEGPLAWIRSEDSPCGASPRMFHLRGEHLYVFTSQAAESGGCVVIGVTALGIETLKDELGLKRSLETMSSLPGIRYVRHGGYDRFAPSGRNARVDLIQENDSGTIEARVTVEGETVAIGMEAGYLATAERRLWRDFFFFSFALAALGGVLSFALYREQSSYVRQVQAFDRELSDKREEAALGRAAAALAHEIRNPLNALGMGLQRLRIEASELDAEHRSLIGVMLKEVQRTNGIVKGLLAYAQPRMPEKRAVNLDKLVEDILGLYRTGLQDHRIEPDIRTTLSTTISADPGLLRQVVENLVSNAMEAQPEGGFIRIETGSEAGFAFLKVRNSGLELEEGEMHRMTEPYFTTKSRGAGLGLSIVRRIVLAHGGKLEVRRAEPNVLEVAVFLPIHDAGARAVDAGRGANP